MNRRQKIIVSVTGIFLVLLLLVGLTYAYFLTRITGNTNDKSISVSTANLAIVYGNDDGSVIGEGEKITPGTTLVGTSLTTPAESISGYEGTGEYELATDFPGWDNITYGSTQEEANTGENTIIEETAVEKCDSVINKYLYDKGTSTELGHVSDCAEDGTPYLEIKDYENVLSVAQDDYGVSYYYRGAVEDNYVTFADMCWRIVRIEGDGSVKLILEDQDQICGTSINGNWAIPTTTGGETYTGNFGYTSYEANTLTASDGTTNSRTISAMDYLHGETNSDISMATAFKNFQSTLTEEEKTKLKAGDWCLADDAYSRSGESEEDYTYTSITDIQKNDNKVKETTFYYDSYIRLFGYNKDGYQATLKCNGTVMNDWDDNETNPTPMYVGAITADEVVFAGGKVRTINKNYYLINEEFKKGAEGENKASAFRTLAPYRFNGASDSAFSVSYNGILNSLSVTSGTIAFRPSISLNSSAVITGGNGTLESPYIIGG